MKDEQKTGKNSGRWKGILLLGIAIAYLNNLSRKDVCMNYPELPKRVMSEDINKDGLADLIQQDGKVLLKQSDGTYKSLMEMRQNELDSAYAKINARYAFYPEKVRNSVDNLDYPINTGRYVIGN